MAADVISLLTQDHREVDEMFTKVLDGDAGGEARVDLVNGIIRELSMHAVAEEEVLYPAMRKVLPDGGAKVEEALTEHQRIKEALSAIDGKDVESAEVAEGLRAAAAEVRHHVEEEEGELF